MPCTRPDHRRDEFQPLLTGCARKHLRCKLCALRLVVGLARVVHRIMKPNSRLDRLPIGEFACMRLGQGKQGLDVVQVVVVPIGSGVDPRQL